MKALNELITDAVQLAGADDLVAIRINEAMHPTPSHLYQNQVADVLGRSEPYVAGLIRSGVISKNAMGKVPIAEVHLAVAGEALGKQRGRAA